MDIPQADECENFCNLLKVPMSCKDTVLPDALLTNCSVKCLTDEENTRKPYNDSFCLLRVLALHLHGNARLEEKTSYLFNFFLRKTSGAAPESF